MITDTLENAFLYEALGERLARGLQYIKGTDFTKIEPGRYFIDGEAVISSISSYQTKNFSEGKFEAHKKYIDIQCLVSGSERIYYAPLDSTKPMEPYNPEKDVEFLHGNGDYVTLLPGRFAIFFPTDAHMPNIACDMQEQVKKIVIKVSV